MIHIDVLDTEEWKIDENIDKTQYCLSVPYKFKGKVRDGWFIGPLDKNTAYWLYDAIKIKQSLIKECKKLKK